MNWFGIIFFVGGFCLLVALVCTLDRIESKQRKNR